MANDGKQAALHRMVMREHTCPFGLMALDVLMREGFEVADHHLTSRAETDAFKREHGVQTTPQVFIDGQRIGGYDDLRRHLGKPAKDDNALTYVPVFALFAMAASMAVAANWAVTGELIAIRTAEWAVAFSMCLLALQKLKDIESFSTMFLNYDLLAKHWVPYGRVYPFAEGAAGVLMIAGALTWISVPVALFIGAVGAASVFKAVYVDRRELKCACVGGDSNVPLGFVSLTENLMMIAMALWMLAKPSILGMH